MEISKAIDNTKLVLKVVGRLDTVTAPQLEQELKSSVDGMTELEFDFENLEYISSAGLRVILAAQKIMNKQGSMVVKNVSPDVREVFDITGFSDVITIQ